jgi:hypothetical protein
MLDHGSQSQPARGDALRLLRSLTDGSAAGAFFDPQHRGVKLELFARRERPPGKFGGQSPGE